MTSFFTPGVPKPQGSKNAYLRGGKVALVESSKELPGWRKTVRACAEQHFPQPLDGPIHADVTFVMPRTKAMRDKPAPPMIQRPDSDKLLRAVFDSITGVAFWDDSQVTHITAHKRRAEFGEQPGARVTITEVLDD